MNHTDFLHNSLYGKGSYLIYWYYIQPDNQVSNNIFYYEGSNIALYMYYASSFVSFDYNDYYILIGNLAVVGTGTTISNLSALKGWNVNYNKNSFEENPEWVDKSNDHHITKKFPEMYGGNYGVDDDYDYDTRCRFSPSIGPDYFQQTSLPLVANFLAPDTAWLGSNALILNSNKPSKLSGAMWYVNGKFVSDSIHLEYTPTNTGLDTIQLIMENCSGQDSVTKYMYVSPVLRKPSVDFSATSIDVYTDEVLSLLDLTANGATSWKWSIDSMLTYNANLLIWETTYKWTTDSTIANPRLYFTTPGTYTITLKVANSFGADSLVKTAYIKVRQSAKLCDFLSNSSSASFGTLYDNGGADADYSPGLSGINECTYTVESCKGDIEIDFTQFDLGDKDYFRIYVGNDNSSRPMWNAAAYPDGMTGNKTDKSVVLSATAKSGALCVEFVRRWKRNHYR